MPLDLQSTIFNIKLTSESPQVGSLLVAEPFLKESHFNHSVILLVEHEPGYSSMGIVLNKHTGYRLGEVVEGIDNDIDVPVYCGGPVGDDRMFYLHTLGDLFKDSIEISPGLYLGGDYNQVLDYIKAGYPTDGILRFFIGYTGWSPGQLNEEMDNNVWAVAKIRTSGEILTEHDDTYWHRTVRQMGERYRGWQFHPIDPNYN